MSKTTLYKLDKKGKLLKWIIDYDDTSYWTESGYDGGTMTTTSPTTVEAKNIGRANETSVKEQVALEVNSRIQQKLDSGYTYETCEGSVRFDVTLADTYDKRKKLGKLQFPYLCQPKLDGLRCYIRRVGKATKMFTRNHKPIVSCPHIIKMADWILDKLPHIVLDGELYNHDLKDNFNKICSCVRKTKLTPEEQKEVESTIQFHCFDVLDTTHTDAGYIKRNDVLYSLLLGSLCEHHPAYIPSKHDDKSIYDVLKPLRIVGSGLFGVDTMVDMFYSLPDPATLSLFDGVIVSTEDEVNKMHSKFVSDGFEGIMLRSTDAPYEFTRTTALLKYKLFKDAEYEIVDFEEGKGNSAGIAAKVVCKTSDGQLFKAGCCGSMDYRRDLLINKVNHIGKLATIKYQELTPVKSNNAGGVPRFGKMLEIRDYE